MVYSCYDVRAFEVILFCFVHQVGGELINEAVLAMEYGASAEDIARVCHAHPVSIMDLLIVTVYDETGRGWGWVWAYGGSAQAGGKGNRQRESQKKYRGEEREGGREGEGESDVEVVSFLQTCSEALREASLMAYCGKAINY